MSTMIFDKLMYDQIKSISLILFLIGVGFMFLPIYSLIGNLFKSISCLASGEVRKEKNYKSDYNQFRTKFQTEYARANPITRSEGMREYFQFLNRKVVVNLENFKNNEDKAKNANAMLLHMLQLGAQGGGSGEAAMPIMPMMSNIGGPAAQSGFGGGMPLLPGLGALFDDPMDSGANPFAVMGFGGNDPFGGPGGFFGPMFGGAGSPRNIPAGPVFDVNQLGGMGISPNPPMPFQQPQMPMDYGYQPPAPAFPGYDNQMSSAFGSPRFDQNPGLMFPNPAMPPMGMNNPEQPYGYGPGNFNPNMMPFGQPAQGFPQGPQYGMGPQYGQQPSLF